MKSYPFLGAHLDRVLCSINLIFDGGANGPKPGALLLSTFGPLFMAASVIATYESFKPVHRRNKGISGLLARAASWFTLLGQRITAGFALPLQRVFTSWSSSSSRFPASSPEGLRDNVPDAKFIWATLLSTIIGLVLPSLYMQENKYQYDAISIWQPFPLYTLALNIILPPLFSWTRSRYVPTLFLTLLVVGASVRSNHELVKAIAGGEATLREVFLLDLPADQMSISFGAHVLFAIDMASVFLLNVFAVLFSSGIGGAIASAIPFAAATALLGPGGAVALFWGVKELGRQRALAKSSPVLGKLKTH